MSLHQLKATQPVRMTPRSFFDHALPLVLEVRAEAFRALGARFAFQLQGEHGGAWTLDCRNATVAPGADSCDAALVTSAARFELLMSGRLDVAAAERGGELQVAGERALWAQLAPLLQPLVPAPRATTIPETLERVLPRA